MIRKRLHKNASAIAGLAAILFWSFGPAFSRGLTETLGTYTSGAIIYTAAGLLMFLLRPKGAGFLPLRKTNPRYWLICGTSYVGFMILSNLSTGIAATREVAVISGLLKEMWPLAAMLLTIPINKTKPRPALLLGILFCLVGAALANYTGGSLSEFLSGLHGNLLPLGLALLCSLIWGIYSNFLPLTVKSQAADYLPFLTLAAGLLQIPLALLAHERPAAFGGEQLIELVFMVVFSICLGNYFWNLSMQGSGRLFVIIVSNLIPAFAVIIGSLVLGVALTLPVLIGSFLIVIGTIWSKHCLTESSPPENASNTIS